MMVVMSKMCDGWIIIMTILGTMSGKENRDFLQHITLLRKKAFFMELTVSVVR